MEIIDAVDEDLAVIETDPVPDKPA